MKKSLEGLLLVIEYVYLVLSLIKYQNNLLPTYCWVCIFMFYSQNKFVTMF